MRIVLLREKYSLTKMHVYAERLNVLFVCFFALAIILGDRCDRKTPKQLFYSSKT